MSMTIQQKIQRLRDGEAPRVLDLFAGCGGISLGFQAAGFKNVGAVEFDPAAARSHAMNFHRDASDTMKEVHGQARDIVQTEPVDLLREFGLEGDPTEHVDVVVGGPPCQSFARVGRAKLREVAEHPEAYLNDPRGNLYLRYLHYVQELSPVAILMENVPDVLNYGGHNIAEEVCEALRDLGYDARYTMLNAVFYGVPEMRERMFLVAFRKELSCTDWFPDPSHWINLPRGYHGSRQVAMKTIKQDLLDDETRFFVDPPEPEPAGFKPAVTAKQALSDLAPIADDSEQKLKKGPRRFDLLTHYSQSARLNEFQRAMRHWPDFEAGEGVYDHVIRYLPRDYKIFARMKPGDQYPQAFRLASEMFEERLNEIERVEGKRPSEGSARFEKEKKNFIPPYDPGKFPNKWRKMESDQPARTLMAHLGKDSYSHIHYDSRQARTISVREAARLQSFPDGFIFQGPMNPAFRQIGNAVPPLMARALAEKIKEQLTGTVTDVEKNRAKKADTV
ncbi:DNA cytosine methyltransferase [Halomonas aquatica]|uniref:DNA (cytosine-5-)-methyltransferase n=1 Tax=Halomonas aquatica TaxID=3151123 RepID=A0ABV1NEV1_9GAMM